MPTLSLCMIVKDEQEVIHRCLSSIAHLADEIIIADTGSSDDTVAICQQFTTHIYSFTWQQDFALARNFAFSKATGDYILWLDADDVIDPEHHAALLDLKNRLSVDVYFLPYNYSQDEYGQSTCTLYRERILKNDGTFQWKYPVHEVIQNTHGRTERRENIPVRHARTHSGMEQDKGRNLDILQHAVQREEYVNEARVWCYLGRELHDHQRFGEAIAAFERFLLFPHTWQEDRMIALFRIAQCHGSMAGDDNEHAYTAETYARKAIALDARWAEPYFVLGEIAFRRKYYEEAAFWFAKCLRPVPDVLSPVNREMYNIRPYVYLVFCHDHLQQYEAAWDDNEQALLCKPQDRGLLHNRSYLGTRLAGKSTIAWYGKNISSRFPAYRIRAIQMQETLQRMGVANDMTDDEAALYKYHTIIFFKGFTEAEHRTMKEMKAAGKQIILDVSENLLPHTADFPWYLPMISLADKVICCSHELAAQLSAYHPATVVIEDAVEPVTHHSEIKTTTRLKAGWTGMPENACHAEALRELLHQHDCELVTIHTGPGHHRYWTMDSWQYHLSACDFMIAPQDVAHQPSKSNNKITAAMAMGLPVIASPLDAYNRIIRHGYNGLIAATPGEWASAIQEMKSASFRADLRRNGYHTAMIYRPENMALKWWKSLLPESYKEAAVDIIIPTIYDTPHIYYCVESITACTQVPYNIIVINSGHHQLQLPASVKVIQAGQLNYAAALNLGISVSTAPYICMMNDDIIVSDGWLPPLLEHIRQGGGFCNPLSNCDYGFLHQYHLQAGEVTLSAGTNILDEGLIKDRANPEQGIFPAAIWTYRPGNMRRQYTRDWVPFFCTVTSRKVIEKVGWLDDAFNNGCEDVDLCRRAMHLGFGSSVNENSFVFHFGGTSTMPYVTAHPEEKNATHDYFREKYKAPLLCIHAGYAYESWNAGTIRETGMGGSETAVAAMAREFSEKGYRVVVCCNCRGNEGMIAGVQYLSLEAFRHFIDRHYIDVLIVSRYAGTLQQPVRAGKKYFWMHDVFAMGSPEEKQYLTTHIDDLDGIFCLSPWHCQFAATYHQLPIDKFILTGNGIDLERFTASPVKEQNRFIYSSSPDRSLDVVLRLFPKIRAALPGATLHIYYGFDNWVSSAQQQGNAQQLALIADIKNGMQQEGVYYHGRVDQQSLAMAFLQSDIWLYPTSFTETFCITALEAQASRTLCICSNLAGLSSTVADRGILLQLSPGHADFDNYLIQTIVDIQQDTARKNELLDRAGEWAWQQSWRSVADQWQQLFEGHSAEVNHLGGQVNALQR
jgi:glycosyltransferase involved in cell wall biosynthesis